MWLTLIFFVVVIVAVIALNRFRNWYRWKRHDQHKITEDKVLDEWLALINTAASKSDQTLEKLARAIEAQKIPNISISKKMIKLGRDPRPFLVIEHSFLKGYYTYVGALPYGDERLNVVWYLVLDTPEIAATRRSAKHGATNPLAFLGGFSKSGYGRVLNMSILDKLELTNYVSLIHQIVVAEVKSIMDGLHLDFSKVNTTTRGFLNLS